MNKQMPGLEEKLNNLINTFLKKIDCGELDVYMGDEWAYYNNTKEISYILWDHSYFDIGFMNYVKKNYKCPTVSIFTLSLMHEVGHYLTINSLDPVKLYKAHLKKKKIEKITVNNIEKAIKLQTYYCNLYDERIATTKAIELIKKNYKTVLMFEYLLAELLKENAGALAQR